MREALEKPRAMVDWTLLWPRTATLPTQAFQTDSQPNLCDSFYPQMAQIHGGDSWGKLICESSLFGGFDCKLGSPHETAMTHNSICVRLQKSADSYCLDSAQIARCPCSVDITEGEYLLRNGDLPCTDFLAQVSEWNLRAQPAGILGDLTH